MVGIIVDSHRMQVTKDDWNQLLAILSKLCNKQIKEFHARDFYRGNGPWCQLKGNMRSKIITEILQWLKDRKHKITFGGIDKEKYFNSVKNDPRIQEIGSLWCMLALHQVLIIQKAFQKEKNNKGNTVFIFDKEETEEKKFARLVVQPPVWTNEYYGKDKKQDQLDQVVDVPYYGDSELVNLIQIADLVAYLIRMYIEITEKKVDVKYPGEDKIVKDWIKVILEISLPRSSRYLSKGRDDCSNLFYEYAPQSLRVLGK